MLRLFHVELYRNSRRVIVLALLAVYLFLALTGAFKFFGSDLYFEQMREMARNRYADDTEKMIEECRFHCKQAYAYCLTEKHTALWFIPPGILGIYLTIDQRKRRVSEMVSSGNSRFSVFCAKSLCYALLCAVIPVFCGLLHFLLRPANYTGYFNAGDFGFFLYDAGYMLLYYFFSALMWLPMNYLCGEPVSGLITSFFCYVFLSGEISSLIPVQPEAEIEIGGWDTINYLTELASHEWGVRNLMIPVIGGMIAFLAAWLIFQRRPLK